MLHFFFIFIRCFLYCDIFALAFRLPNYGVERIRLAIKPIHRRNPIHCCFSACGHIRLAGFFFFSEVYSKSVCRPAFARPDKLKPKPPVRITRLRLQDVPRSVKGHHKPRIPPPNRLRLALNNNVPHIRNPRPNLSIGQLYVKAQLADKAFHQPNRPVHPCRVGVCLCLSRKPFVGSLNLALAGRYIKVVTRFLQDVGNR